MPENQEIKEYIKECIMGVNARLDSRFDLLDQKIENMDERVEDKLESINKHLEKQNGRIGKAEEVIAAAIEERAKNRQQQSDYIRDRVYTCPQLPLLHQLKQENISRKEIKRYIITTITIISIITGIIVGVSKLIPLI